MSVRRFLTRALASVAVLTALAVLDLGPRASAAYLSAADRSAGSCSLPDAPPTAPADSPNARQRDGQHAFANQPAGTGTTNTTGGSSGPNAPAAELPPKEPPAGQLVVYLREPAVHLELSKYVDSILDPPRPV
jgi:hypothetical protein